MMGKSDLEGAAEAGAQAAQEYASGDFARAARSFARALELDPSRLADRANRAMALSAMGQNAEAEAFLLAELDPGQPLLCATLGLVLRRQNRPAEALPWLRRALLGGPERIETRVTLANALADLGRHDEAIAECRDGLRQAPDSPLLLNNLGLVLAEQGDPLAALVYYDRAVATAPDHADIRVNRAHAHLLAGHFLPGWADYVWRHSRPGQPRLEGGALSWDGRRLAGERVLVRAEQGLGDVIQFARFLPRIRELGGQPILACDRSLIEILSPLAAVVDERAAPPDHEWQVRLLDLAGLFAIDLSSLPGPMPYLRPPDPPLALPKDGRLRVGLVWAGRPGHANDRNRSCPLAALAPLFDRPDIAWYSLQLGQGPAPAPLIDLASGITSFSDTARALAALDLLISVDTAPVHLAGALGRPAFLMLPFAPDWRWLLERGDSPWYPSLTLFRQPKPGDWASVVAAIGQRLSSSTRF
jgi:Tfp pilus assembly protein PilF